MTKAPDWDDKIRVGKSAVKTVEANRGKRPKPQPNGADHDEAAPPPLRIADIAAWVTRSPPPMEWSVPNRFPLRAPSLLGGPGSTGKSILLNQLATAHILGRDWLGSMPEQGDVVLLNAEDDEDELHRRFAKIVEHYGATISQLVGHLHLLPYAGHDALLGVPDRSGVIRPTPLFRQLHQLACDVRPKNIILDTATDIYGGNENDRGQVRQFISLLRGVGIDANSGVLVAGHPSLTGIATGSGLSGSTAWHNSMRARGYLRSIGEDDNEPTPDALRELSFKKSNYGPVGERIVLRLKNGVFVPEPTAGSIEQLAAEAKVDATFLDLLARYTRERRSLGHNKGPTFAPALFAKEPRIKITSAQFNEAMNRLFAANRIHVEQYGKPSKPHFRIAAGPRADDGAN